MKILNKSFDIQLDTQENSKISLEDKCELQPLEEGQQVCPDCNHPLHEMSKEVRKE